jgi:hypothetical protein
VAATVTGLIALADIRPAAATALAPLVDTDPYVLEDVVDSVTPPALMLAWDDPWLQAGAGVPTMGPCLYTARLQVVCVAARLDPGSGVDELERLVAYVLDRMRADTYTWPLDTVTAPEQRDQSGVASLVANVIYAVPTTV